MFDNTYNFSTEIHCGILQVGFWNDFTKLLPKCSNSWIYEFSFLHVYLKFKRSSSITLWIMSICNWNLESTSFLCNYFLLWSLIMFAFLIHRHICCTSCGDGFSFQEIGEDLSSRCCVTCVTHNDRWLLAWNYA